MITAAFTVTQAQNTAPKAFVSAPREVVALIDSLTRLDMIDYYNSGSEKPSNNKLGGNCRITGLSTDQISFYTSGASERSITVLPARQDTLLMVVNTVFMPASDSSISFYTAGWDELTPKQMKSIFREPTLSDWVRPEYRRDMPDIENAVPFMTARYDYDPTTRTLTLTHTLDQLLPKEDYEKVSDSIHRSLRYTWNGKAMVRQK